MTRAAANGIDIEYDTFGERTGSPLLLIMGHGIAYPALWDEIAAAITQHTSGAH
jgi:hypothetical protein